MITITSYYYFLVFVMFCFFDFFWFFLFTHLIIKCVCELRWMCCGGGVAHYVEYTNVVNK